MTAPAPETGGPAAAPEPEQRVTALELFFDLVFVFAITQVTASIAHVAFRLRNVHTLNRGRLLIAVVLVALIPVATRVPALAALATVAALCCALMAYEFVHFHEARERQRHALT